MKKKTLVIGASEKPARYSYKAITKLTEYGHSVEALGLRNGEVAGITFKTGEPKLEDIDTIAMYVGPARQPSFYDYIVGLKPKRILFNPGTENPEFYEIAKQNGIEVEEACTLVLLSIDQY